MDDGPDAAVGARRPAQDVHSVFEAGLRELGPEPDADAALAWAARAFGRRLAVASSMSDPVVAHLVSQFVPDVDVVFLDTGLHFVETLGFRDRLHRELAVTVVSATPPLTVAQQAERFGPDLHLRDPASCCRMRKVDVMDAALEPYEAWATGLRRADSETRRSTAVLEWDARRAMVKLNPIAAWSDEEVAAYVARHDLPEHPLRPDGYLSIGCAPCTRPVSPGEPARAGRWADTDKTECGLHDDPVARSPHTHR
jgi:phosphoadenosine phosphosulfate reductase